MSKINLSSMRKDEGGIKFDHEGIIENCSLLPTYKEQETYRRPM